MNEILNSVATHVVRCLLVGSTTALVLVPLAWVTLMVVWVRTSVYRHMMWLYTLIGCILLPLIWLYGPKMTLAILPARAAASDHAISSQSGGYVRTTAVGQVPTGPANLGTQSATVVKPQPLQWGTAVAGVWLAGFAFMLARLVVGWRRLRRICLSATPVPEGRCQEVLQGQTLAVRLTSQLPGPVCFGVLRPIILLPQDLYHHGTAENLRMVLTHEVAHIERHDAWVNLFQRIVESMYFFHPLVWWASRQLTQQRQQICDNHVLADGASPDDYTTLLSHIGERTVRARYLQTVAFSEGQLLARIRALLDPSRNRQTKLPGRVAAIGTVAALAGVLVFGSVRLAAQPSDRATGASAEKPVSSAATADSEKPEEPRFAARTFNATTSFDVFTQSTPLSEWKWIGRTPSVRPVGIPACWCWWVQNRGAVKDWDLLGREIEQNQVPGLGVEGVTDADVKRLAGLTGLRFLRFGGPQFTDKGLADLKDLTGLRFEWLALGDTQVTDAGLSHLAGMTRLRRLDLRGIKLTDAGLEHLRGLTRLERLGVSGTGITDAGLEQLKGLTELQYVGLEPTRMTDATLEHLKDLTGLRTLNLSGSKVADTGLAHLQALSRLQELYLDGTQITDAGLAHLEGLTELRELNVYGTRITDVGLRHLKGLTKLERLNLPHQITDAGLEYLNLKGLVRLQSAWFGNKGSKITDAGIEQFKGLSEMVYLALNDTQITDAGLAHLRGLTRLQRLWLNNTPITGTGLTHLKGLTNLSDLRLGGTQLTDAGLEYLKGLTALETLDFGGTKITDAGLRHIKTLTGLRWLFLQDTKVTDLGLEHLRSLSQLGWVNLSGTEITDAGLPHLKSLTGLQRLNLADTQVTDAGIQQLKQSLPQLTIGGGETR